MDRGGSRSKAQATAHRGVTCYRNDAFVGQTWLNSGLLVHPSGANMLSTPTATSSQPFTIFDSVPEDYLGFGLGEHFNAREVCTFLSLKKDEVSRLADVSSKSVRYDDAMPELVRERLQEIAITINLVAQVFGGNTDKTVTWFKTRNPLLGDVSPRDMVRLGRFEKLRKFILNALIESRPPAASSADTH